MKETYSSEQRWAEEVNGEAVYMNSKVATKHDEYLRIKAFAKKMDMSEKTLRRWCAEGRIAHVRFSRTIRIPLSELNRLVTEGTVPTREA